MNTAAQPTRVDWPRVLDEVRQQGYSLHEVSTYTGIARSTLVGYKNTGNEPPHAMGDQLLRFWAQTTGNPADAAPRVPRFPSTSQLRRR